jgi:predicted DCC family thiol-disulfide oxidoreductase YuxK
MNDDSSILILFDGVCNLCNGAVQFIIKRDKRKRFIFASLQSSIGQQQLTRLGINPTSLHSIIVIEGDRFFERSDAALKIASHLDKPWPIFAAFKILPTSLRDAAYNLIAKNRYTLFGKRDQCMIPTPDLKARFIEG